MASERGTCELEKLTQVVFEELLTTLEEISYLKVDLDLLKNRHNLFVDLAVFNEIEISQQVDHESCEIGDVGMARLTVTEN